MVRSHVQGLARIEELNLADRLGCLYSPGRFHAADEIRLMLGYFVLNYDIAFKDHPTVRPPNFVYSRLTIPNGKAEVMLKKREGVDVVQC